MRVFAALLLALVPTLTWAQHRGPSASQLTERRALAAELHTKMTVRWDPRTGAPSSVGFRPWLRLPTRLQRGAAEVVARRLLYRLRRVYGVARLGAPRDRNVELAHTGTRTLGPWTIVRFAQRVDRTPVEGSDLRVVLTRRRRAWVAMSVAGRVFNDVPTLRPRRPRAPRLKNVRGKPRAVFTRHAGRWQFAFEVDQVRPPKRLLVDAQGKVLRSRDPGLGAVLQGRVHDTGGSSLRPLADLTVEVDGAQVTTDARGRFRGQQVRVPGGLRGTYEVIVQGGTAHEVRRDALDYASRDPRAEEVSAYYHLVATRRWLDRYDDLLGGAHRARVFARILAPMNNAQALRELTRIGGAQGWEMKFGAIRGHSAAEDGSVVSHERCHLLQFQLGFVPDGEQANGIHEGLADYLAGSRRNDPLIGPGLVDRNLSTLKVWPQDGGEAHRDGWIFGGAVWDARQALGARTADRLTLAAIPLIHGSATLLEGRDAFLAADRRLNGGRNEEALERFFKRHGIGDEDGQPPTLRVDPEAIVLRPGDATRTATLTARDPEARGCRILLTPPSFMTVTRTQDASAGEEARIELSVPNDPAAAGVYQIPVTAVDGDGRETTALWLVAVLDWKQNTELERRYQVEVGATKRIPLTEVLGAEAARRFSTPWLAGNVSTTAYLADGALVLAPRAGEEGTHTFTLRASTAAVRELDSLIVTIHVDVGSGPVIETDGPAGPGQGLTLSAGATESGRVRAWWDARRQTGVAPTTSTVTVTMERLRVVPPSSDVKVRLDMWANGTDHPNGTLEVTTPESEQPRVITLRLVATRADGRKAHRDLRIDVLPTADDPPSLHLDRTEVDLGGPSQVVPFTARDPEGRAVRVEAEVLPLDPAFTPRLTLERATGSDPPAGQQPPRIGGSATVVALGSLGGLARVAAPEGAAAGSGPRVLVARVVLRAIDVRGQQARATFDVYGRRPADPPPQASVPTDPPPPAPTQTPPADDEPRRGAAGALDDALGD